MVCVTDRGPLLSLLHEAFPEDVQASIFMTTFLISRAETLKLIQVFDQRRLKFIHLK